MTNTDLLPNADRSATRFPPLLSRQREMELARRWRQARDEDALHQLVTAYQRLVVATAKRYRGYGLPMEDLIQEGTIGLLEAAKRFDPDRGFRFATYAIWWVRAGILDYVLANWSIVKMGRGPAQKKLFYNLARLGDQIDGAHDGSLSQAARRHVATALGVSVQAVENMEAYLRARDNSLNAPVRTDGDTTFTFQDLLTDPGLSPEEVVLGELEQRERREWLRRALNILSGRGRNIVVNRRLAEKPLGLREIGATFGISGERVRQIENAAISKLQRFAEKYAGGTMISSTPSP